MEQAPCLACPLPRSSTRLGPDHGSALGRSAPSGCHAEHPAPPEAPVFSSRSCVPVLGLGPGLCEPPAAAFGAHTPSTPPKATLQVQHTSSTEQLSPGCRNPSETSPAGKQGRGQLLLSRLGLCRRGVGCAQMHVVTWPAGVGCSSSSCCRTSSMLGRSWGFTAIMEHSRRCRAAEYLRGERERAQHGPAVGSGTCPPTPRCLTWKMGARRWGSALPEPRCRPSGRPCRRGPPRTSCSTARSLGTAACRGQGSPTPHGMGMGMGARPLPKYPCARL